jgi:hypothetical protein
MPCSAGAGAGSHRSKHALLFRALPQCGPIDTSAYDKLQHQLSLLPVTGAHIVICIHFICCAHPFAAAAYGLFSVHTSAHTSSLVCTHLLCCSRTSWPSGVCTATPATQLDGTVPFSMMLQAGQSSSRNSITYAFLTTACLSHTPKLPTRPQPLPWPPP